MNAQTLCVQYQREEALLIWPLYIIERVIQQLFSDEKTLTDRKVYLKACISRRPLDSFSPSSAFHEIKRFPFLPDNDGVFVSRFSFTKVCRFMGQAYKRLTLYYRIHIKPRYHSHVPLPFLTTMVISGGSHAPHPRTWIRAR